MSINEWRDGFMKSDTRKVLVISHIAFSDNNNMSKTLSAYFKEFDKNNIAQLYFYPEFPSVDNGVCENFYRITDTEAIKSIFLRFDVGNQIYLKNDTIKQTSKTVSNLHEFGRKRSPLIYLGRDIIWSLSAWYSRKLKKWLDDFQPDIIFFASGDYAFSYNIAYKIARKRNIPLIISCMDDFYLFNMNSNSFLGRFRQKCFMKTVKKTINYSSGLVTLNTKMNKAYSELFQKPCFVYHNSATSFDNILAKDNPTAISYLGNLSLGRYKQLIDIGRALKEIDSNLHINVYSSETNKEVLSKMIPENGINFCGKVSADKVNRIIKESLLVIHTESFDEVFKERVRYSTSTKIPDCLLSGTCMLAYGPSDIASIEYLKENDAAFIIDNNTDLKERLIEILNNGNLRENIIKNEIELAQKKHSSEINSNDFHSWLMEI